ncbi:ras GTPase activating protein-like protein [Lepidopterella palustris CBS 459.81]|uniref:Ras GTPase activating protein-like protein n=1 Tax=Lepidopterella palustris CBS 459.81 TaxID=1314670 RepID=A0A8E2E5W2_9PEZI|nr:ras GTPase activating protein-like protein [Lepidopterella palustris CBS 459.81]
MTYQYTPRTKLGHTATSPSPLRHASNASSGSSAYSNFSNPYPPSRTSTISSNGSSTYQFPGAGHRRGVSEATGMSHPRTESYFGSEDTSPSSTYKCMRQSLRPLPQAPASSPISEKTTYPTTSPTHSRSQSVEPVRHHQYDGSISPPPKPRPLSMAISRSDSIHAPTHDRSTRPGAIQTHLATHLEKPDLQSFGKSTTGHLRTLSRFAETASEDDFTIASPEQEVVGMHGRRRLQRTSSSRGKKSSTASSWASRNWMDQQRQFLQAYEYLCHIGEAKEWIEDIINQQIPPIVQLEEALRDGVTLAEIVQAIQPERRVRIFRHPRLQFRHSDNIAMFFRFLAEVELPELFRFELVDLYEKKNIPKVIYCIHALSWLLFRKGIVDFRIGNLVGQLQFEDHELEAMQKGLDKAGISMPNFSGMGANFGAEPEPEPVESEEDRIHRELEEDEGTILDLQAQIRGALVRIRLGNMMQELWDSEQSIVDLQSMIRGDWTRQISSYRMDMRRFAINLQSAARGFLLRSRLRGEEEYWQDKQKEVVTVQSLFRARKARAEVQYIKSKAQRHENGVRKFQAAIRGALKRMEAGDEYEQLREAEAGIQHLQAIIKGALRRRKMNQEFAETKQTESGIALLQAAARGMLLRQSLRTDRSNVRQYESTITIFQAAARGALARRQNAEIRDKLVSSNINWSDFQARIRGGYLRDSLEQLREELKAESPQIIHLQAVSRGTQIRKEFAAILDGLKGQEKPIIQLQSSARGFILRQRKFSDLKALQAQTPTIVDLQSACRGFIERQRTYEVLCDLNNQEPEIVSLQSSARGMLVRAEVGTLLAELDSHDDEIVDFQALTRGMLVRRRFVEKRKFYKENMEKVVKIQSFIRGRQQGEAYKSLTSGKNPPVGTIKNFVHLLNDSDFDFDEEIEFERLRKTVVQHVRQNEMAEQYIDQLDIKIALLVKNKITLDEVVKHQKHFGGHVGTLLSSKDISSKDPFDLKALNKNSRKKLEHYQELFFILQTQPQYLARLFKRIREQGIAEKELKRIEQLTMGLFGLAQKRREEYYLLKLMSRSLKEEVDGCGTLQEYLRGNFFWGKIFASYVRSPRDRKFLRNLFGHVIKENIIENDSLDLESDPMQIYRSLINNEELRTGQRSRKIPDIPREEAIRDPETRETFIGHLQDLRDICDQFFASFEDVLHRMPYGVRFIAQQTFELLRSKFPYEAQEQLLQIVGHWVWKSYLQPSLLQPQHWGVIDRGLSPLHNRNLGEVGKVLSQIAAGRLFGGDNVYLQPLNSYVSEAIDRIQEIWTNLINVRDAEAHFDIDEFNDLYARTKPTLYIKLSDIFAIHNLVVNDISALCPAQDDMLREVIRELGSAKNNENEMMHVSSTEITLTLNPKLHDVEDPDAAVKALFMETKRYVLYIIRIQTGANLMEIMVRPITPDDEDRWDALVREELDAHNTHRASKLRSSAASTYTTDMTSTTLLDLDYPTLKRQALENILTLEHAGRINRHNHYQDLLNAIAVDIRTKHRRRVQRAKELEGVRATLCALDEKAIFLDQQLKSYNDYIEQAMVTLQNKKGKKRFLLPFTKQYNHERELQKAGRVPKFGSFKYSARTLAEKGVLVAWQGYSERQWDKLDLTIQSDSIGVFRIEGSMGSMMIPGASAEVPLDGLLQAQFDNHQFMNLFGGEGEGVLRLNVNLFLHLVFKKFYRDE